MPDRRDGGRRILFVHAELRRLAGHVDPEAARERRGRDAQQHRLDAALLRRERVQVLGFTHRFQHQLGDAGRHRVRELPRALAGARES